VRGVVVSPRCKTQPDETNRRRAIREVDVSRCCDLGGCSSGIFVCGCFQVSTLSRFRQDALRRESLNLTSTPPCATYPSSSSDSQAHNLYYGKFSSHLSVRFSILICAVMQTIKPRMANTTTWRCRECLAKGITADFRSYGHMKSHLAGHGYGPWRCSGCDQIGRRRYVVISHQMFFEKLLTWSREAIVAHHLASGERDATAYNDPALNDRINTEVRECRLPHQAPWTGSSAVPPPDTAALDAARAAAPGSSRTSTNNYAVPKPMALIVAETINTIMPMINHLSMRQRDHYQQTVYWWIELLKARLTRIEDAESLAELALRLQHLAGTVVLHQNFLTTEREQLSLEAAIRSIEELRRQADRDQ
jgi:hypothetical protein